MSRFVLFVVNQAEFFVSHRLDLALAVQRAGYRVEIAVPETPGARHIREAGLVHHAIDLGRHTTTPLGEAASLYKLVRLFERLRPDVVHLVAIKPNIYGTIAARIARVPLVVNAISGLGFLFTGEGLKAVARRRAGELAYRLALGHPNKRVIIQNPDDLAIFLEAGLVDERDVRIIRGSGADTDRFVVRPEPSDATPVVVLAARLLRDKGIIEYVTAARALHAAGVKARFVLAGDIDDSPTSFTREQVTAWQDEGAIEWWGHRSDMPDVFASANVVCLPSYREGLPKSLIEAAACGRAIVTCDVPGCREIVKHGENGLLVPARDSVALAAALKTLLEDGSMRARFGARGRAMVEESFSTREVIARTLAIYEDGLATARR